MPPDQGLAGVVLPTLEKKYVSTWAPEVRKRTSEPGKETDLNIRGQGSRGQAAEPADVIGSSEAS